MAQYISMLEFYSGGGIPLVCTMYASSESYFGVNLRPLCSPTNVSYTILPNMVYFEFIPLENCLNMTDHEEVVENDKLVSLVDVKVGCHYELVVITFSGKSPSPVGDLGMFVGKILPNLYENEVEGVEPGPHHHGGAVVATTLPWARAGPLTNGIMPKPKQACLPPSGAPTYILQGGTSSLIL
jgi:hypothetical protein